MGRFLACAIIVFAGMTACFADESQDRQVLEKQIAQKRGELKKLRAANPSHVWGEESQSSLLRKRTPKRDESRYYAKQVVDVRPHCVCDHVSKNEGGTKARHAKSCAKRSLNQHSVDDWRCPASKLCPAWKQWSDATNKVEMTIIHNEKIDSLADELAEMVAEILPIQDEGKSSTNSTGQNHPKTTLRTQQQAGKKKEQSAIETTKKELTKEEYIRMLSKAKGQPIVEKKFSAFTLIGTEEEVKEQEERILKGMAELEHKEATTPKIVQEPGRFPIKIIGSVDFIKKTEDALALIQEKSPGSYAIVTNYLSVIKSAKRSGISPRSEPPTFNVGPLIAGSGTPETTLLYAGSIVHDSYHSKLYRDYRQKHKGKTVPFDVHSGREAEDKCLDAQVEFLKDAKAPEHIIKGVLSYKHIDYFTIERTW